MTNVEKFGMTMVKELGMTNVEKFGMTMVKRYPDRWKLGLGSQVSKGARPGAPGVLKRSLKKKRRAGCPSS
jgi:hypothetical protein